MMMIIFVNIGSICRWSEGQGSAGGDSTNYGETRTTNNKNDDYYEENEEMDIL